MPDSYRFSLGDKIRGAAMNLKICMLPHQVLVAGPYVGEFGHELMDWQPWVRAQVRRYKEVHAITYPGRDYLYPGCKVHYHNVLLEDAGYKHGRFKPIELETIAHDLCADIGLKDYDLITPINVCTKYHQNYLLPAKYERLGTPPAKHEIRDVAFHFRNVDKAGGDRTRNYPITECQRLTELSCQLGLKTFCIGHPLYSYCPPDVEDRRSESIEASVQAIRSARLLVGELSGPMHLAQLSGTPILIWAPGQWRLDNCERWNVFKIPTFVVSNSIQPPCPETVSEAIIKALDELDAKGISPFDN